VDLYDSLSVINEKNHCERQARSRYSTGQPQAFARASDYERFHEMYAPLEGDQWAEDKYARPGKLHITANMVKAFVDIASRILALEPRVTNRPNRRDKESRNKAEIVEELFSMFLRLSDWDRWRGELTLAQALYGLAYLHPFWNERDGRPDVRLIDQPQNLMQGFSTNDYREMDWAIYHYSISPLEATLKYPQVGISNPGGDKPLEVHIESPDHTDPLGQTTETGGGGLGNLLSRMVQQEKRTSDYEDKQVSVWDYWYRDDEGGIKNATLLQQRIVDGPHDHPEMPDIPYIPVEYDHEPGSPEGQSLAELIIPIQMGLNRVMSQFAQIVADNAGTAYQFTGENAFTVPEGMIPREDEVLPVGPGNRIEPINRAVQNFPMERLIEHYWDAAYKITGIPEIAFGGLPGAQTSGRAVAIQIEAMANRLSPKRDRLYFAMTRMLRFWGFMLERYNPEIEVRSSAPSDEAAGPTGAPAEAEAVTIKVGDFIKGFDNWRLIAPEMTPRDSIEQAQNVIQLVQNKLMPLAEGMDNLGFESPEQMIEMIRQERSDPHLFPQDVQAYAVLVQLLSAIQAQQQQQAALAAEASGSAAAQVNAAEQAGGITKFEDQNNPGIATAPGGPPEAGTNAPVGTLQPLLRQTSGGESQAMSQIQMNETPF
jgi:hypothetical protein